MIYSVKKNPEINSLSEKFNLFDYVEEKYRMKNGIAMSIFSVHKMTKQGKYQIHKKYFSRKKNKV